MAVGALAVATGAVLVLTARKVAFDRELARLEQSLCPQPQTLVFKESMLEGLPAPAQRYLRHAIAPGTRLATSVSISMTGRMKPAPEAVFVELAAEEVLTPAKGFVWRARLKMKGLPVRVVDYYSNNSGVLSVSALGIIPLQSKRGSDVSRSTRGRMGGESVWIPSLLLPILGASWEEIDDDRARVTVVAAGEKVPLTLKVDPKGRLIEITMMRHGDVAVPAFQQIPYGFSVEEESTFDGYTIPTRIRGGWWFGTDRYDDADAASFIIQIARYR